MTLLFFPFCMRRLSGRQVGQLRQLFLHDGYLYHGQWHHAVPNTLHPALATSQGHGGGWRRPRQDTLAACSTCDFDGRGGCTAFSWQVICFCPASTHPFYPWMMGIESSLIQEQSGLSRYSWVCFLFLGDCEFLFCDRLWTILLDLSCSAWTKIHFDCEMRRRLVCWDAVVWGISGSPATGASIVGCFSGFLSLHLFLLLHFTVAL